VYAIGADNQPGANFAGISAISVDDTARLSIPERDTFDLDTFAHFGTAPPRIVNQSGVQGAPAGGKHHWLTALG
jgi:hypothetical protein